MCGSQASKWVSSRTCEPFVQHEEGSDQHHRRYLFCSCVSQQQSRIQTATSTYSNFYERLYGTEHSANVSHFNHWWTSSIADRSHGCTHGQDTDRWVIVCVSYLEWVYESAVFLFEAVQQPEPTVLCHVLHCIPQHASTCSNSNSNSNRNSISRRDLTSHSTKMMTQLIDRCSVEGDTEVTRKSFCASITRQTQLQCLHKDDTHKRFELTCSDCAFMVHGCSVVCSVCVCCATALGVCMRIGFI